MTPKGASMLECVAQQQRGSDNSHRFPLPLGSQASSPDFLILSTLWELKNNVKFRQLQIHFYVLKMFIWKPVKHIS